MYASSHIRTKVLSSRLFSGQAVKPRVTQLLIDGKFTNSQSGKTFDTLNPADEKTIAAVQEADSADVNKAVKAARRAFDEGPWRKMDAAERGRIMHRFTDLLEKNIDELAALEALDNGKPLSVARNVDLNMVAAVYRYYAGWPDKIHGKTFPMQGPFFGYTRQEPVGVAAQIIPWNFPLLMQAWKLGPALATGCTVVMKPAEQTPLTALRVGELLMEAGLPEGVVNILPGYGATGKALAEHPDVDKVAFTGSTEVGKEIMRNSSKNGVKRVTLELGGKSANIIMDDADMNLAIAQSQLGLFLNQGQCCIAGTRLFVQEGIYDEFVQKSVEATKARKVGDPFAPDTDQGPQVSKEQMDQVLDFIESGKKEGATLLTGGSRKGDKGYYVESTVFTDVTDDMKLAKEEHFGPIMSILKFKDIDEVLQRANNSEYGLGAGLVTRNLDNAIKLANGLRVGTVYVNCYDVIQATTPFGGYKDSGIGRELGEEGLKNYLETKTVIMKRPDDSLP